MIIAIDPGVQFCGVAFFSAAGKLWHCELRSSERPLEPSKEAKVFVERMVVYPGGRFSADLLDVSYAAGRMTANFAQSAITKVPARDWKGQLPRAVEQARTLAALTSGETRVLDSARCQASLRHNILSAIGLGLYAVGRGR